MKSLQRRALLPLLFLLGTVQASATTVTLYSDFESPAFQTGLVNGQSGWANPFAGPTPATISTAQAHSGSQSLRSGTANSYTALDPSQSSFSLFAGGDWWVQAWVRIDAGGSGAQITLSNGLGGCPLLQISGSGVPYFNSCLAQNNTTPSLGANVLNQWILVQMVHTVSEGAGMHMNILGTNVNVTVPLFPYSGPGSGNPVNVNLFGDAYWDDVSAGYGALPSVVPVPAAAWLFGGGLGLLGMARRRRAG